MKEVEVSLPGQWVEEMAMAQTPATKMLPHWLLSPLTLVRLSSLHPFSLSGSSHEEVISFSSSRLGAAWE